jgi:hypothetical protein
MLLRGEASEREIYQSLHISRQLVRYWCIAAGIAGKVKAARANYVMRRLLQGLPKSETAEPEHATITTLRQKLKRPRPSAAQIAIARHKTADQA